MKHLKLFLTILFAVMSVATRAMDYPDLILGHRRTVREPWLEFKMRLSALKGIDNYLNEHEFYLGHKIGTVIINATTFNYSDFNYRTDDDFGGTYGMNDIIYRDDNYVVELREITGFDNQFATVRVYKRQEPLEYFGLKFWCNWETNDDRSNYTKYLDFAVDAEELKRLREMQLNQDTRVYFVSPETMIIDAHFGSSSCPRYFSVSGQAVSSRNSLFNTTSPKQASGRYEVKVSESVGRCAITNPFRVSLTEHMSLHEYCTQTFPAQVFTTKIYAQPTDLSCATDQYAKSVTLTWKMADAKNYDVNDAAYVGKWYVYRRKEGEGESSWTLLKSIAINDADEVFKYVDNDAQQLLFDTTYEYSVCFYPNYWLEDRGRGGKVKPDSQGPMAEFSTTKKANIATTSPLIGSPEAEPLADRIKVKWNHHYVPKKTFSGAYPTFTVQCQKTNSTEWVELAKLKMSDLEQTEQADGSLTETYVHSEGIEGSCMGYMYRIVFDRGDNVEPASASSNSSARISGGTTVDTLTATKGFDKRGCNLTWKATQVGTTPTTFLVSRRDVRETEFHTIYTTQGTASAYSYYDQSCEPGRYYEYRVDAYSDCEGQMTRKNSRFAIGFAQNYGTIGGQVLYGSGDAVDSVRVTLTPNSSVEDDNSFFYATHFDKDSPGIMFPLSGEGGMSDDLWKGDFTIGVWVKPASDDCTIFSINGFNYHLSLVKQSHYLGITSPKKRMVDEGMYGTIQVLDWASDVVVWNNKWTFVFMTHNQSAGTFTVGTVNEDGKIVKKTLNGLALPPDYRAFMLGHQSFTGYDGEVSMDEFRLYRRALSDGDILRTYDRMLSGNEPGLAVYWPMNEGYPTGYVYDRSITNGTPNNVHGVVREGCSYTEDSPNQTGQVSCYGLTDEKGSYLITGIPFSGNGINYTITPSKGIHEFNSSKQTRFISNNSLVYSGVNFTDVSYFPVHGTVRYAGTTIPVDSCTFEVDGTRCMVEGIPIMTDAEGKFTISVPIGDHYITVKRNDHVFVDKGRYPANSGKHTFLAETYNLDFEDATLVNFAGRIVGGFKDQNKPLGFRQSENNIGRATMTLTPTDDRGYLNAKKTVDGTTFAYDLNDERVEVASDTSSIASHAYRGYGSVEECRKIYIETDAETGEFSALLPPISYQMSAQTLVANSDVKVGESRTIDLSKFNLASADTLFSETTTKDPTTGKETVKKKAEKTYDYQYKYIADYHTTPVFKVNEGMAFGSKSYTGSDEDGKYTIDKLYTQDGDNYSYKLGYPVFISGYEYEFAIEAYESYKNADNPKAEEDRQPLKGCFVQIANALSSSQSLVAKTQTGDDGEVYEEGSPYGENLNGVQLDSLGQATYTWCAGLPNTNAQTHHANSITMQLCVSDKQYDWVPDEHSGIQWRANGTHQGPGMKGVNVGAVNMGNNFVTLATDKVVMVLRDPPGAKSSTTWTKGSTVSINSETIISNGAHTEDIVEKSWGETVIDAVGNQAHLTIFESDDVRKLTAGADVTILGGYTDNSTETYTTTQDISTSDEAEYVGSWGDLYIGFSRNRIFGDARKVYIPRDGSRFDVCDVTGVQDSLKTTFIYSQLEILTTIIPNYEAQIRKLLKDTYGKPRKRADEITTPHYYSNLPESDPNYGRSNYDKVFGNAAKFDKEKMEGPSYAWVAPAGMACQDTLQFMLDQIAGWKEIIRQNEQEKVMMYEDRNSSDVLTDNISFDGGAKVTRTYTSETQKSHGSTYESEEHAIFQWNTGGKFNSKGIVVNTATNSVHKQNKNSSTSNTQTQTFSFTLADNDYCDHSVDVYRKKEEKENETKQLAVSRNGWSPIFRTRAGHTYGPYEDGDSTLFFSKGEEIMAKTIQMEVPQLIIDEPLQGNVPNGGSAFFKVKLSNQSYAQSDHYFKLGFKPDTNPKGAVLTVDGMPLLEGMKLCIPYNKTIEKTIELKQGDKSILDYNDIKIYLRSTTQDDATSHWPVIESVVPISAYFVPVSTDVALHIDHQVVNTATGTTVNFQVSDFDLKHEGLKALRLQYRYNNNDWTLLKEWVTGTPLPGQESLTEAATADGGLIKLPFDMKQYVDGNYTFRVMSATAHGNEEEVTKTSEEIHVIKDTKRPALVTLPMPSNGVLDLGSIISAEFNEDISADKITQDNNIEVYGTLVENSKNVYHVGLVGQNAAESQLMTQNKIDLRNKSFTAEFWAKNANGYLLTFGTNETMTALGINDKRPFMVIANGGTTAPSASSPAAAPSSAPATVPSSAPAAVPSASAKGNATVPSSAPAAVPSASAEGNAPVTAEPFELSATDPLTFKDDEWVFWQLSYNAKDPQIETSQNTLSLTACYGDQTKRVFNGAPVPDILSNGKMTVGGISTTEFADLALWNYARGDGHLPQGMKRKSGLEDGLWHYWMMEEGHGQKAEDSVGGNHITVPDNGWFIDNINYSAHLTADKHLAIPMGDCNIDDSDSYALEFWYKRSATLPDADASTSATVPDASASGSQQLLRTGNDGITMTANANGRLALKTKLGGEERNYESVGTFGNEWHHVLLNVQRGISAMVYVDGTSQMAMQEKMMPSVACDSLYFGNGLTGDIDEVRIWRGLYSNQALLNERYNMIDTATVKGLVRYYPFEHTALDEGNQAVTTFSPHNAVEPSPVTTAAVDGSPVNITHDISGSLVLASTTPPLKVAPTRSNLYYTFTASNRKVTITIDDAALNKLEGTTVNISLKNIPDVNGNSSNRISWNAYVRKNPLRWGDLETIDVTTDEGTEKTFTKDIVNLSAAYVSWTLHTPSWLSASPASGTIEPNGLVPITFTVSANVPVGKVSESIGLTNVDHNMTERCAIDLHVLGKTPEWSVDKSDKEFSIPLTARLVVNNAYSEDESDLVAAFVEDVCVGVSSVQYNSRRNSYFVNMTIYGGQNQMGKSITFKAWDASRNVTYSPMTANTVVPSASAEGNNQLLPTTITFTPSGAPIGSYDNPLILTAGQTVEQIVKLKKGWNWVSFFVNTTGQSLNDALKFADGKITTVKTQTHGAEWNSELDKRTGKPYGFMGRDLESLNENSMYAMKAVDDVSLTVAGILLTADEGTQIIDNGWTWIRNPFYKNQSLTSAFSGFEPADADVLQARDSYAQWSQTYHRWEGTMTNFMPGVGFKYYSGDSRSKTIFEDITTQNMLKAPRRASGEQSSGSNYGYADNMLIIAKLLPGSHVVNLDTVAVTAINDSHETFTTLPDRDYYVITVAGTFNSTFTFAATINGQQVRLYPFLADENGDLQPCDVTFMPDDVVGTFASPIILTDDTDIAVGILEPANADGDYEVYSLQGYLMFRGKNNADQLKTLPRGIYIVNGRKVVIK